jgi:hypothetical protein
LAPVPLLVQGWRLPELAPLVPHSPQVVQVLRAA